MASPARHPLIICFGDSLTAGYQSPSFDCPTVRATPYGDHLARRLRGKAEVLVTGICGEVTGEMVLRFRQDVLVRQPASVVILGGTNDLGWQAEPAEIMRNLIKMYEQARGARIRPVAVTVPSIRIGPLEDESLSVANRREAEQVLATHLRGRHSLNRLIGDYCHRQEVACVDLFQATVEPDTLQLAALYSNDGLHLTTAGYRLLADLLFEQVFATAFP